MKRSRLAAAGLLLLSVVMISGSSGAQEAALPLVTVSGGDCLPQNLKVKAVTGFKLNTSGLESLRLAGLPPEVLEALGPLQDRFFLGQEVFTQELIGALGADSYAKYEEILLAVSSVGPMMSMEIGGLEAQTTPENPHERQSCGLSVVWEPVSVADETQVRAVSGLILQGQAQVPAHGRATLTSTYRLAGEASPPSVEVLESGFAGVFTVEMASDEGPPPRCGEAASESIVVNLIAKRLQDQAEETWVRLEQVGLPLLDWTQCVESTQ
jgi:hypothetical protein